METRRLGIVMNGVTGRMGTNQHLIRSILAIREQGGVRVSPELTLMPEPILAGRNENKLRDLATKHGVEKFTTDVEAAIKSDDCDIVFDASATQLRGKFVELACKAGKPIYCEKPTAIETAEALRLAKLAEDAGIKNGVVQDKLWLPGIRRLKQLVDQNFFGEILSIRGEFGYWVFAGDVADQPVQRPSWNYRKEDGGGIIVDMFCHWQYVLAQTFGPVKRLVAVARTDLPQRRDESGKPYTCTADDSAYAIFELAGGHNVPDGTVAQFNSSWVTRVRRDDLLTIQVDGTHGSAVAGLRECHIQHAANTPKPVWNPDIPQPIDFHEDWAHMPAATDYDNAFKIQWELFLRH
ncbi:MAG: Gfo/Idh/MocA family oxidoreductase, partial [Planctomycetota bacterium]